MKTSNCMCCGKTWTGLRLYRKKPKGTASQILHNAFCSRECAWKFKNAESDRKARCGGCYKATGKSDSGKCEQCRIARLWITAINEAMQQAKPATSDPWIRKLSELVRLNEFREAVSRRSDVHLRLSVNEKRRSVWKWGCHWLDICSRLLKEDAKKRAVCPWMKSIHNKMRSQRQRLERKAMIASRQQRGA